MQRFIVIACLTAFAAATPVFAQQNADEPDESTPDPAVCLIGDHGDVPEADARTSAFLVCRELRDQGIQVGEPVYDAPDSAAVYRVSLHILGQHILVRLSQEIPAGTVVIERELLLASIEEMVSAAPRLADALVNRTSLAAEPDEALQTDFLETETLTDGEGIQLGFSVDAVLIFPFFGIDVGYSYLRAKVSATAAGGESAVHASIVLFPVSGKRWSPYFGFGGVFFDEGEDDYATLQLGIERDISKYMQLNTGVVALLVGDADFLPAMPFIGFRIGL